MRYHTEQVGLAARLIRPATGMERLRTRKPPEKYPHTELEGGFSLY